MYRNLKKEEEFLAQFSQILKENNGKHRNIGIHVNSQSKNI